MNTLIFVPPLIKKLHEIDIKNSTSNFTPTEDEFIIKDSMWPK